jgi:Protein of unknown function (DUF2637)
VTAMRKAALAAITVLVAAATSASFAESYRALYEWAARHGLHGVWAVAWPLQVDVFIGVGELALFVGLADQWRRRDRLAAWTVTLLGLAVSVAGNVGHVSAAGWTSRLTAAVPPLAAAAALAVGLGVLKRVVAASAPASGTAAVPAAEQHSITPLASLNGHAARAAGLYSADLATGKLPSIRRIRREMHVGQPRAEQVQAHLRELAVHPGASDTASGGAPVTAGQARSVSPGHTAQ